jgi:hypothetical protein
VFAATIIAPGRSADVNVHFTPTLAGAHSATLRIVSDDPASPTVTVNLSATVNAPSETCLPPSANMLSWLAADGTPADALGGTSATLIGNASYAAGYAGRAFDFDGNTGHATLGNPASLRLTNAISIEAWINPRQGPAVSGSMSSIVTKWGQKFDPTPDSDSYGLWIRRNGSTLTLFSAIHQAGTSEPNVEGGTIPPDMWSHVAMTFDATSGQYVLYLNGQSVASANSPGPITATTRNVLVGREDSFLPRPFNGLIDEISIYSRALTAAEIRSIYSAGSHGKCKSSQPPAATPSIDIPTTPIDFGGVIVNQNTTRSISVSNRGNAALTATIGISNSAFTVTANPFPLAAGASGTLTIRFAPPAAGVIGPVALTITTNDPARATITINLSGAGIASTSGSTILSVDKGSFEQTLGFPDGGATGHFVNRLTPPSYPATLRSVLVLFPQGELPAGTPVSILSASNPTGAGGNQLRGLAFQRTNTTITAQEIFVEIAVPALTITGGDFVVGYSAANPPGVYPVAMDTATSHQRSYIGTDSAVLTLIDSTSVGGGNFAIRAKVDLGTSNPGGGGTITLSANPTSVNFGNVAVNTSSQPRQVAITNSGTAVANVTLTLSPGFAVTPARLVISPGETVNAFVTFNPVSPTVAQQSGILVIAASGASPVAVSLTGTATASINPGGGECVVPPNNQAGWWTGDATANDAVGGGNGSLQGGASFTTGRVGQAFAFNGTSSYVQVGNPANLRLTAAITIEAWINPRAVRTQSAGPAMGAILTKWAQRFSDTPDSDSFGLWIIQEGGAVKLFSALHQAGGVEPNIQGGSIPLNTWTHVAMTFDSATSQFILYVNGNAVTTGISPGGIYSTDHAVQIGREDSYIGRVFDGLIDEAAIYSRALSASEIAAIYDAGSNGKCKSSTPPPPPPGGGSFGPNLIRNPGAEEAPVPASGCSTPATITGWTTNARVTLCAYATNGFLSPDQSLLPPDRGSYFFGAGGFAVCCTPGATNTISQTISLGANRGGAGYKLGGWFSGYGSRGDNARLLVTFRGAAGDLGTATAGPVSAEERGGTTRFLEHAATGTIPAGTTSVFVEVIFTLASGGNDAYADNLSFTLAQ